MDGWGGTTQMRRTVEHVELDYQMRDRRCKRKKVSARLLQSVHGKAVKQRESRMRRTAVDAIAHCRSLNEYSRSERDPGTRRRGPPEGGVTHHPVQTTWTLGCWVPSPYSSAHRISVQKLIDEASAKV